MIKVVESGRNPTMRYIGRTHGVSVAWLHETFKGEDLALAYEITTRMCADIYTKAFTDADKWRLACWLINICDPQELQKLAKRSHDWEQPPTQSGGESCHDTNPVHKAGGPTEYSGGASAAGDGGSGSGTGGASAAGDVTVGVNGGASAASSTKHMADIVTSDPKLQELRLGRRFTYKRQHYMTTLHALRMTFKEQENDGVGLNSDRRRLNSSETELSGQGAEHSWSSTSSRRLTPQQERLVRAVNTVVNEKFRAFDFTW